MPQPFTAIIPADALDVSGLPSHARQPGTTEFKKAVSEMLAGDLQAFGLDGTIKVTDDNITISWADTGRAEGSVERAVNLLRSGDYSRGIRLLQILEKLEPENPTCISISGQLSRTKANSMKLVFISIRPFSSIPTTSTPERPSASPMLAKADMRRR